MSDTLRLISGGMSLTCGKLVACYNTNPSVGGYDALYLFRRQRQFCLSKSKGIISNISAYSYSAYDIVHNLSKLFQGSSVCL